MEGECGNSRQSGSALQARSQLAAPMKIRCRSCVETVAVSVDESSRDSLGVFEVKNCNESNSDLISKHFMIPAFHGIASMKLFKFRWKFSKTFIEIGIVLQI